MVFGIKEPNDGTSPRPAAPAGSGTAVSRSRHYTRVDESLGRRMAELEAMDDAELAHIRADDLLCDLLEKLGFAKTVAGFRAMGKYYS